MKQEYDKYTPEDHQVWQILYDRQMDILPPIASKEYLEGIKKCRFTREQIPNFDEVNEALDQATGWQVYVVPGLIDNKPFFEFLAQKQVPATTWLRKMSQIDYLEEPDMFHDTFGHIPLLSIQPFVEFLEALAKIALKYIDNPWAVELLARLYWYAVEFGLIREDGELKIYGAGILSSPGESVYSIESDVPRRLPFDIPTIFDTPYIKDKFQAQYFVIESYDQLFRSIPDVETLLEKALENAPESS